jgi:hypothetical protein
MRILKEGRHLANGFFFLPIHFSHDREGGKNTIEWEMRMRESFPRASDFDKEMEIDFGLHVGTPAYPRYSDAKHLGLNLPYDERRPLALAFDFNANPMSLIVGQVREERKTILAINEFVYGPTTIDEVVNRFRNAYPAHRSDIRLYGDATSGTNAQTARSNWQIVELAFRGYPVKPELRVPKANPHIVDRLNSVNRMLQGVGPYNVVIDGDKCPELTRDLREVILSPDGKGKIHKVNNPEDPYYFRTHASDAFGYWIFREWPVLQEIITLMAKKRAPLVPGQLLGEVDYGPRDREQKRIEEKKRQPMNRDHSY